MPAPRIRPVEGRGSLLIGGERVSWLAFGLDECILPLVFLDFIDKIQFDVRDDPRYCFDGKSFFPFRVIHRAVSAHNLFAGLLEFINKLRAIGAYP